MQHSVLRTRFREEIGMQTIQFEKKRGNGIGALVYDLFGN